jgi:hypothetical protein
VSELGRWFRYDRLTLNLKKTEYVRFAGNRPPEGAGCPNVDYLFLINQYCFFNVSLISIGSTLRFRQEVNRTMDSGNSYLGVKRFQFVVSDN